MSDNTDEFLDNTQRFRDEMDTATQIDWGVKTPAGEYHSTNGWLRVYLNQLTEKWHISRKVGANSWKDFQEKNSALRRKQSTKPS
jgi:hypothetical protein